jgi:hypothetical protein
MPDEPVASRRDRVLTWLLRMLGAVDLLAVAVVFLPNEFIDAISQAVGLRPLPELPAVDYLVRSCSALYALHGALLLGLSTDVVRHRPLIRLLGWLAMIHGGLLFHVDTQAGVPDWWRFSEGPTFALCGLVIAVLSHDRATDA